MVLCRCGLIRPEPGEPRLSFLWRQAGNRDLGFISVGGHGRVSQSTMGWNLSKIRAVAAPKMKPPTWAA